MSNFNNYHDTSEHVLDEVDCYWHGTLKPGMKREVEQHCRDCERCDAALAAAKKRFELTLNVAVSEANETLVQSTLKKIAAFEEQRRRRRKWVFGTLAAACLAFVLLIIGAYAYEATLVPSPYDVCVRGSAHFVADADASLRVAVVKHDSGDGVQNVPVEIEIGQVNRGDVEKFTQLVSFETDAAGTGQPRFHVPNLPDGSYQLRITAKPAGEQQTIIQPVTLKHSWKVMLSSDRPIYKPGDAIRLRSLALRSLDLKPVAGGSVVFTITDPKDNVIFKRQAVTSTYGISSADCALADEIIEGLYTVKCQVGDSSSSLKVKVEKYVLPEFKVAVEFARPWFEPGERIAGKVSARYYYGLPVTEGLVEIKAAPGWKGNAEESQSAKLGPDGQASFSFPPVPEAKLMGADGDFNLEVFVKVTDAAGQTQGRAVGLTVTAQPLRIEAIPEAGSLVAGVPNNIFVLVSTVEGRPAGKVRLLISEQEKELSTNDMGFAQFEYTPHKAKIDWTIQARNNDGQTGRRQVSFTCSEQSDDFILRTDRAVYLGGETVELQAVGGKTPVLVDLVKDGQTLATQTIPMTNGKGEASLTIPAEVFGTVQLSAYRDAYKPEAQAKVRAAGTKRRLLYIQRPGQIHIATKMDQAEYKPRSQAKLEFTLTDPRGNPAPGALSLAIVDEKLFGIMHQPPGSETGYFTWNPEVLHAISTVSWSPGMTPSGSDEERKLFERAVFARPNLSATPAAANARFDVTTRPENLGKAEVQRRQFSKFMGTAWVFVVIFIVVVCVVGMFYLLIRAIIHSGSAGGAYLILAVAVTAGTLVFVPSCTKEAKRAPLTPAATPAKVGGAPAADKEASLGSDWGGPAAVQTGAETVAGKKITSPSVRTVMPAPHELIIPDAAAPRIRDWFPETLFWRPELITDNQGKAPLSLELADSITTWRLTASAVNTSGWLGASNEALKVLQPFFVDIDLPVAMTRLDEVDVPIRVANYLDRPQQVVVKLADADWFDLLENSGEKSLTLQPKGRPGNLKGTSFRLRLKKTGIHEFLVTAQAGSVSDGVRRKIDVLPEGRPVELAWNGILNRPVEQVVKLPDNATEGSPRLFLNIYPSPMSQALEGLESILQMPYGCFEQTSSTTYPNVLALDYMRRTNRKLPKLHGQDVETIARNYISAGYQRLVSYEVKGGGFDWFGRPPANRTLTAYGLMEFQDMARVHDVDPNLIARTRRWLLEQRQPDGSWDPEGHTAHGLPGGQGESLPRLRSTAYIAWAVFGEGRKTEDGGRKGEDTSEVTRRFLLSQPARVIDDPYVLALVANALLAMDGTTFNAEPYLDRLESLKKTVTTADGKLDFWEQRANDRTAFYGSGQSGQVETTALAALALMRAKRSPGAALDRLTTQRDPRGSWYSTQATVLALKALLAGEETPSRSGTVRVAERRVQITVNDHKLQPRIIPEDQAEVMVHESLTPYLKPGDNRVTIAETSGARPGYQLVLRYNEPDTNRQDHEPFSVKVDFDKTELKVKEMLKVTATVRNEGSETAPMVMVELPVPAGFTIPTADWTELVKKERIAKYETRAQRILVYLRDLEAGKSLELPYSLQARIPVQVHVPAARVYEYYNPARSGTGQTARLTVVAAKMIGGD